MGALFSSSSNGASASSSIRSLNQQHSTSTSVFEAVEVEYREMAPWYDWFWGSYSNQTLQKPLELVLQELLQRQGDIAILDVGCGTGELIHRLVARIRNEKLRQSRKLTVYGIEPSKEMLQVAEHKLLDNKKDDSMRVVLMQSTAESMPLPDASIDVVVSSNCLHFVRDKPRALDEMHRVLKSSGRLVITDWCSDYVTVRLYHWLERLRWFRFETYPSPLSERDMQTLTSEKFQNVRTQTYRVFVWGIFVWGMQTLTACALKESR